jgi:type IV secretion system protein VirB10
MAATDPRDSLELRDIGPTIPLPSSGLPVGLLVGIAFVLALILFFVLDARRQSLLQQNMRPAHEVGPLIASPAPLTVPVAPPELVPDTTPAHVTVLPPQSVRPIPPPNYSNVPMSPFQAPSPQPSLPSPLSTPVTQRADTPILAVDTSQDVVGAQGVSGTKDQMAVAGGDDAVRATLIRNRASLIPQGTLIQAVLETPLNSNRPGLARAVVSRDALSFDGTRVLIPRGSRLIGESQADTGPDARRVLVTWTRMIRPDGVAIRIGSPAGDVLGGAGIPGKVNTHFIERFANAVLQSAFTVGVNLASQSASGSSVYIGIPGQAAALGQQLLPNINPRTTIKVPQGAEISIFVAHDLDFGGTPPVS